MAVHPVARTDTSTASTQSQASGQSTAERASANVISEHQVQYANRLRVHLMTFQGHAHPALVGQERTDTSEQPVMSRSHLAQQHQRRRRPHQLQWTEPAREMSIHREHPGKMGRRRLRRYNNDHFVDHPCAAVALEDLQAPIYLGRLPFCFSKYADMTLHMDDIPTVTTTTTATPKRHSNAPCHASKVLGRAVRRHEIPLGLVRYIESVIVLFLHGKLHGKDAWTFIDVAVEDNLSSDSDYEDLGKEFTAPIHQRQPSTDMPSLPLDQIPVTLTTDHRLVWEATDSRTRFIIHTVCDYYRLKSYSNDAADGKRLTFIEKRATSSTSIPPMLSDSLLKCNA